PGDRLGVMPSKGRAANNKHVTGQRSHNQSTNHAATYLHLCNFFESTPKGRRRQEKNLRNQVKSKAFPQAFWTPINQRTLVISTVVALFLIALAKLSGLVRTNCASNLNFP